MKKILLLLCALFAMSLAAAAAGFYPSGRSELSKAIDGYLKPYKIIRGEGKLIALIVPHAGYEYSGPVAGYAFKQLENKSFDTVIVIGPSHLSDFDGIAVMSGESYSTPLGTVSIDTAIAFRLTSASPKIVYLNSVFKKEHSVDNEVPFLQKTLRGFKLVPIVMGRQTLDNCQVLADAVSSAIKGRNVLIVASTDLSHYHSEEAAAQKDSTAMDAIGSGDIAELAAKIASGECEMCGYGPVITAMAVADGLGANSYEILKYGNSGVGSSVVGYLSAAIYNRPQILDDTDKQTLLQLARNTLGTYVKTGQRPEIQLYEKNLQIKSGVFVTLKKDDALRGCMGYIRPVRPLYLAVQDMTIAAASQDPRFTAVTTEELSSLKIEISVLLPYKKISTGEVVAGRDGLIIVNGDKMGVLLPQAAIENKWNDQQLLEGVCEKASLSPEALADPNTTLYSFTAEVFSEE